MIMSHEYMHLNAIVKYRKISRNQLSMKEKKFKVPIYKKKRIL